MMKASELRIGNWVKSADVKQLEWHDLEVADTLDPIPLTEEWKKFSYRVPHVKGVQKGWVKDIIYCFIPFNDEHDKPCFFGRRNTDHKREADHWNFTQIEGETRYVHQFQNLYFAIRGVEIELKN
jgi:hypothetical protein